MKFRDHVIGAEGTDGTIFGLLSSRRVQLQYCSMRETDFSELFEIVAEIAVEAPAQSKAAKKLLEWTKTAKARHERGVATLDEMLKVMDTLTAALTKLDQQCQELTEPKPKVEKKI